jgi:hypothetical protein
MTLHIMHVNLAKGFRGGERQTELLIRALAEQKVRQTLVCRTNSPLRDRLSCTSGNDRQSSPDGHETDVVGLVESGPKFCVRKTFS